MANYDFKNRLVLVTGAGSGIGRATALAFAASGATVIAADINLDTAKNTVTELTGSNHIALEVDVSNEKSVHSLSTSIKYTYGHSPSTVINAAGILIAGRKSIFDITQQDYCRVMYVNLKGTFLINQTFGRLMRDEKINNAAIINFASQAAARPFPDLADYCATKAGVVSLTQNFAHELAQLQIRVNAIAPGSIKTPMIAKIDKNHMDKELRNTPMGRFGEPEEIARLCLFLASTESSYMTGQTLYITGGISVHTTM